MDQKYPNRNNQGILNSIGNEAQMKAIQNRQ